MELISTALGIIILAIVLTIPGYFITLAFFPSKKEFDALERFTFSIVFSITFMPLAILFENLLLGIKITQATVFATMLVLILASLLVYLVRVQKIKVPAIVYKIMPKVDAQDAAEIIPQPKKK